MRASHLLTATAALALALTAHAARPAADESTAAAMVGPDGSIRMTSADYQRDWSALGTFAHLGADGVTQFNVVYTEPATVTAYRETGAFPPGAVIIKELRKGVTAEDGDSKVSSFGALTGWFVLIKPPATDPPEGPLWGEGWGWAKFDVGAPDATITRNFRTDCLECHRPVEATDWVHVDAYPVLHR